MVESRSSDAFQPGEVLNNTYKIEAILGRGGTSDVYRARSEISGRLVALKVLKAEFSGNDDYLVLLTREEEIRDIRHDSVVRYSENHRTQDGHVYLLMDYVEGPGLDKKLREGPMSADDLMTVCRRVAEGLEVAHNRNIVHRDLSPDNIILRDGDPAQAVIIDFGIAKDTNPGAETIVGNEFAGKYAYAAPEQLSGQTDARSDIYSLGALLLANYRGAAPDIGSNPMEVVQRKSEKLNTEGVAEPLKTLIDQMTDPDPAKRLQSASDVLKQLSQSKPDIADADGLDDATVIVPKPRAAVSEPDQGDKTQASTPVTDNPEPPKTSKGGLISAALVALVMFGGAGGYFSGAFDAISGPTLPVADPFTLIVQKPENGAARAVGYVPSEDMFDALTTSMSDLSGKADLTLASGSIADTWGADVLSALSQVSELDHWRLSVSGNTAQLAGKTSDKTTYEQVLAAFSGGLPGALDGDADIQFTPIFLQPVEVIPILDRLADCGPLVLANVPVVGFAPDNPVTVTGRVSGTATRVQLFDDLRSVAGDRQVILDVDVLNPTLCLIETHLPNAPDSGIDISFIVGDRDEPNPSGRFYVGENPVIDITLPADVTDGFLTVSILDVSGNVFHLLPNLSRQENDIATLRAGQSGPASVRVAYSLDEAAQNGRLAFRVDDSTLGKSKVIVLHSSKPLFAGLRPTSESAVGYAEALKENFANDRASIVSLDSRILTTAQP